MEKYCVEFKLYQYNSGASDNGTYTRSIECDTLEEAQSMKAKIDKTFNELKKDWTYEDEDVLWVKELIHDLTICGGFLKSTADIYVETKTKLAIKN
jgi:hypothetical protein